MPNRPPRYRPTSDRRTPEHRPSAARRGYGRAWRERAKQFLDAHPLCVLCRTVGKLTGATVVDHIVPHRGDQGLFDAESNWQPLCKRCHDCKTAAGQ